MAHTTIFSNDHAAAAWMRQDARPATGRNACRSPLKVRALYDYWSSRKLRSRFHSRAV